ncbi:MAG: methyltransferase domain-containing protein [Thermodesulfobacteriota bacterium]
MNKVSPTFISRTLPSIDEMATRFTREMGWTNGLETNQAKNIFNFIYRCAQRCSPHSIVLDVSAGQCRYKPFFSHAQYIAIDNVSGDPTWDYSCLDLVGDAMKLPIKPASIDTCLNFTSLEHYPDPHQVFREFARVLKPGGHLFLYVPFVQVEHQMPSDFFRYTRFGLAYLVRQSGMEIETLSPVNGIFETMLDFMNQAISLIAPLEAQNHLRHILATEIKPIFKAAENAPKVLVEYPLDTPVPQLPVAYCLSAILPGHSKDSVVYGSRMELINAIAACPDCKNDLEWNSSSIYCPRCKTNFIITNGIPNLDAAMTTSRVTKTPYCPTTTEMPEISGIRPADTGIFISLRCRACGKEFESYQTTIAGVPIARHICLHCRTIHEVEPEIFLAALDQYLPGATFQEMIQITEEASRIGETWYRSPTLADLLTYRGVNLGEPMERELLSFITTGLYSHWAASNRRRTGKAL